MKIINSRNPIYTSILKLLLIVSWKRRRKLNDKFRYIWEMPHLEEIIITEAYKWNLWDNIHLKWREKKI